MSKLYEIALNIPCVDMGPESSLPMLSQVNTDCSPMKSNLPEEDGLYLRYRFIKSAFPYRAQDNYTRDFVKDTLDGVVLENDHLRATFVPSMGGKLWSLFDKDANKELLFANPVMRPAYLATRNAWCSGGIEWNCGIYGHTPFTCAPMFAATLTGSDGTPILRMYEYERVRGVIYQMDFSLPEDSPVLFVRTRIVNPSFRDTAMYWWSNIAVPEVPGARVVVPAESAYTPVDGAMSLVPVPVYKDIDLTYPENNPVSVDYFFKTKDQPFTCQLSPEGYGLFESSTAHLKGRKIFVWGQGPGGKKWQEYLSGNGNLGRYCEIQCGVASTQMECLPMPPATTWEWMEIYGPLQADPARVHGDWDTARQEVAAQIQKIFTAEALEQRLQDTRADALRPAERLLTKGAGWGALENARRLAEGLAPMCPHLDFGTLEAPQESWLNLLNTGSMGDHAPEEVPASWMRQIDWTFLMEQAVCEKDRENWYTLMQLGCTYLAEPDLMRAEHYLCRSLDAKKTAWNTYAMAELFRIRGDMELAVTYMKDAASMAPQDGSLAKRAAMLLHSIKDYPALLAFTEGCLPEIQELPRIRLYHAFALAFLDRADEAEAILYRDGIWLEVPDIQEGEISLSDLWYQIQIVKAKQNGTEFDPEKHSPPYALDFRMFATE